MLYMYVYVYIYIYIYIYIYMCVCVCVCLLSKLKTRQNFFLKSNLLTHRKFYRAWARGFQNRFHFPK